MGINYITGGHSVWKECLKAETEGQKYQGRPKKPGREKFCSYR